jgi:hypothetical protein
VLLALQYYAPNSAKEQITAVLCDLAGNPSIFAQHCRDVPAGASALLARRPLPEISPGVAAVRPSVQQQGFDFGGKDAARDYLVRAFVRAAANALAFDRPLANVLQLWDTAFQAAWVRDGLDAPEVRALTVIFNAYADAMTHLWEPEPTPGFRQIIESQSFQPVNLPESVETYALATSTTLEHPKTALRLVSEQLPHVESIMGPYPAPYVLIRVDESNTDGPPVQGGRETIDVKLPVLAGPLLTRELARSTLTGKYDAWFREGVVETVSAIVSGTEAEYKASSKRQLETAGSPLNPSFAFRGLDYQPTPTERQQFGLFMLRLTEVVGIDGLGRVTRRVKGRYETTAVLMRLLNAQAYTPELKTELSRFLAGLTP